MTVGRNHWKKNPWKFVIAFILSFAMIDTNVQEGKYYHHVGQSQKKSRKSKVRYSTRHLTMHSWSGKLFLLCSFVQLVDLLDKV